jgi:hypothetical protein
MSLHCNYVGALPIACVVFNICNVSGSVCDPVFTGLVLSITVYVNTVNEWAESITMQ